MDDLYLLIAIIVRTKINFVNLQSSLEESEMGNPDINLVMPNFSENVVLKGKISMYVDKH